MNQPNGDNNSVHRPSHAIAFAAVTASTGLGLLYYVVNPLTAALGAANLILYTSVYTPMKRISIANTWVGSVGELFLKIAWKNIA